MTLKTNVNTIVIMTIVLLFFILLSFYNLLLFHSLAEFTSIVIGLSVLLIVLPINKRIDNHFIYWIGISLIFVYLLDLAHTVTYKGMTIVDVSTNVPLQLWIIARYWQSITLILGFTSFKSKFSKLNILITQAILFIIVILVIFRTDIFPVSYIEGVGVTRFINISDIIISCILLISLVLFYKQKDKWDRDFYGYVSLSLFALFLSEVAFSVLIDFYSITDIIGHLLKIQASMLLYLGIYKCVITKPYNLLYEDVHKLSSEKEELKRDLEEVSSSSKIDKMTGTFNRNHYNEFVESFDISNYSSVGLILLDIDNMKHINDHYGHLEGDKAIKITSNILKQQLRRDDEVFRFGGDEFVIIVKDENEDVMNRLINRIEKKFEEINQSREVKISVSSGYGCWNENDDDITFEELFTKADTNMYSNKNSKN